MHHAGESLTPIHNSVLIGSVHGAVGELSATPNLSVILTACLTVCLSCLSAWPVCLLVCLSVLCVCLPVHLLCLSACLHSISQSGSVQMEGVLM